MQWFSTRWAEARDSSCQSPRSHPLGLKSSPSDAESNFFPHDLDPGWAGSCGSAGLPHRQRKQQVWAAQHHIRLAWDWHPWVISDGGAVPDRILCSASGNEPVMLSLSLHLF